MKNFAFILILVFGGSFLFSCSKEEEQVDYWYSYGTYIKSETSTLGFVIDLDSGKELIPDHVSYIETGVKDSSRVIVSYSIVTETDSTTNANVEEIVGILTKNILQLTEENKDSIGNDGVIVSENDIWFSENHLNVVFTYYYYGKKHFINLVKPIGEQFDADGNQILEFKHNDNDDYLNYAYSGIVSFDMESLHQEGMDSINILFKSMDYDSTLFTWKGTYHFNEQPIGMTPYKKIPEFLEKLY